MLWLNKLPVYCSGSLLQRSFLSISLYALLLSFMLCACAEQNRGLVVKLPQSNNLPASSFHYAESHALLIGVSQYQYPWGNLRGVKEDITLLTKALKYQGFSITILDNPDVQGLRQGLQDFILEHGQNPANRLLIFYAGHGTTLPDNSSTDRTSIPGSGMGFLVPRDAPLPETLTNSNEFYQKAIAMNEIRDLAKTIPARHVLFIFDSCFAGSIFSLYRSPPKNIHYKMEQPVRQFITSGSANEEVPDQSIFLRVLLQALSGQADLNQDAYITGSELGLFLEDNVINQSLGLQHPQYGKIRDPALNRGDFIFFLRNRNLQEDKAFWQALKKEAKTPHKMLPLPSL